MTLIRPIILYGSETWTLRKIEEVKLDTFERKVLRRIYGPCLDSQTGERRIQTNEELKLMFQIPCISREVAKRLMWARHTWRKKETMIKVVIEEEPTGKRPRLKWEDSVERVKAVNLEAGSKLEGSS